jgi:hypothetical protein
MSEPNLITWALKSRRFSQAEDKKGEAEGEIKDIWSLRRTQLNVTDVEKEKGHDPGNGL